MRVQETAQEESIGASFGPRTPASLRLSGGSKPGEMLMNEMQDNGDGAEEDPPVTERRRSLFEPLGPKRSLRDRSPESLLPPPDFDRACYPRGWLIGKKRKLVNVDVVESMRRIAIHEMNRKDREIHGLNEQLEEDARAMEHLQLQLQQERQKRVEVERDNSILQDQVNMLMNMLNELEEAGEVENIGDDALVST